MANLMLDNKKQQEGNNLNTIKILIKIMVSGMIAILILSILLSFYSLNPIRTENKKGTTDYIWEPNSVWINATEGISFGTFDENGFNNSEVIDNPDILLVGSSHMEAKNVMQDESIGYLLNDKFEGLLSAYNIGISGHHFYKICQYLPESITSFEQTPKYVVLETSSVELVTSEVQKVLDDSVEFTESHNGGIVGMLQRVPFFRVLYQQISHGLLELFMPELQDMEEIKKPATVVEEEAYEEMFLYLSEIEEETNSEIIIFYHPTGVIMENGTIKYDSSEYLVWFEEYAMKNGIDFIDMTERFENLFYDEHHVPHGFATGEIGTGHLNKYGHEAVADALYDFINLEEENKKCR